MYNFQLYLESLKRSVASLRRYTVICVNCKWNPSKAGHLIGCDKKAEIVRYFQGRLCDKTVLCDFFRASLHCFIRFQRRKTTLMLFKRKLECKGIIKHLFYLAPPGKRKRTLVYYYMTQLHR